MNRTSHAALLGIALACAGLGIAGCDSMPGSQSRAGDSKAMPTIKQSQNIHADEYWEQHQKSGYMSRDDAMGYTNTQGQPMDFANADLDGDGRVSAPEWKTYNASPANR